MAASTFLSVIFSVRCMSINHYLLSMVLFFFLSPCREISTASLRGTLLWPWVFTTAMSCCSCMVCGHSFTFWMALLVGTRVTDALDQSWWGTQTSMTSWISYGRSFNPGLVFQNHLVLFRWWIDLAHTVGDEFDVDGLERTRCHLLCASMRLFFKKLAVAAQKL